MSIGKFDRIKNFFSSKRKLNLLTLEQFEEVLLESDVGVQTTQALMKSLREQLISKKELSESDIHKVFQNLLLPRLRVLEKKLHFSHRPHIIFVVGVNGVGKTTTIAKMACYYKQQDKKVLLVAADTFRAAATEQLSKWGSTLGVSVFEGKPGMDPSALSYDAVCFAEKENVDVVLIDTAGRLHTKAPLMEELKKMKRVMQKYAADAPHDILMVVDANLGLNVLHQCKSFHEAVSLTGLILTKMDGSAKGGTLFKCAEELALPILFLGVGEKSSDLKLFNAELFLQNFFKTSESAQ